MGDGYVDNGGAGCASGNCGTTCDSAVCGGGCDCNRYSDNCACAPRARFHSYPCKVNCQPCCTNILSEMACDVRDLFGRLRCRPHIGLGAWDPSCGVEAPGCGVESAWIEPACGCASGSIFGGIADASCGCETPSCGFEGAAGCSGGACFQDVITPGCYAGRRPGILSSLGTLLFGSSCGGCGGFCDGGCSDVYEPGCGAETYSAIDAGCGGSCGNGGCGSGDCGNGGCGSGACVGQTMGRGTTRIASQASQRSAQFRTSVPSSRMRTASRPSENQTTRQVTGGSPAYVRSR